MSQLNLDPNQSGWLVRLALAWYLYWRKDNEKQFRYGRKENLCHFVRVLVIWAPLKWVFTQCYGRWFRPWMGFFAALITAAITLGLINYPNTTLTILAAVVTAALIVAALLLVIHASEYHSHTFKKVVKIIFFPLWAPLYILTYAFAWICGKLSDLGVFSPIKWVFKHKIGHSWIRPWMILSALGYITLLIFPVTRSLTLIVTAVTLVASATIAALVGIANGIHRLWNNRPHVYRQNPITQKPLSSLRFALEAIKTFKHNTICPYIEIKGLDY